MTSDRQLTYYDYWLTKEVLQADHAINIISNYFTFGRLFDSCDDYDHVRNSFRNELVHKMAHEDAKKIFSKRTVEATGYGKGGDWVEGKLNTYESDVIPKKYIEWLHDKKYQIPYEFKQFIGLEEDDKALNEKEQQRIDKAICQGIAKTLWGIYPDMTQEEMVYRKEIQRYGNGKLYSADTTLRRWLREVDIREVKTGPKKALT